VFQRVFFLIFAVFSLAAFAKTEGPFCANLMTSDPAPAWAESLKANVRANDGRGHWLEFHYENARSKFINIACSLDSHCADHLLAQIRRKEPAFVSPHPRLSLMISEGLRLSEAWDAAISLSWNQEKDATWSVRLSLDLPPPGKHVMQSENVEIQSETRIERIDVTVSHERTTVLFANVPAVQFGSDVISAEFGSHSAGVILAADQETPAIDSQNLRAEFFHGPMASAPLNRALEAATALVRALRPEAEKILLQGRRGVLAEHQNGRWTWFATH
jgi:hypothetical protein